ncbi:RraA family protein [Rhizobium miluonense]|uniref:Putative 4-hydroxy-4-methyl-2-oxoglutarate aldolase n=1 Tax=Rhizobium miluonense TaxID=411945 RepID=A0A1C3WCJ3_9HYPH|nr:4-hydroxy-4-methyl-2-oxoglutarate aldolase [Rhizobium miluonense]SCB37882.1 Regulator of RNase E activity RraA [Rhizobium miluonense]
MFIVNAMPDQIPAEIVELLERTETATVGHIYHSGFVDRDIQAVLPQHRVAGTAVTVRIPTHDSAMLHYVINMARPGDIIVVDRCGDNRHACWGGGVTNAMKLAGVKAGIIDGPGTDFSEVRRLDFPLWCRGPSPITTKILGLEGAINVPVSVGGQTIEPGDAILADESGVLVLKLSEAEAVARKAIGMQEAELVMLERLRKGERIADISGATAMIDKALGRV